jgi:hypothetical protein
MCPVPTDDSLAGVKVAKAALTRELHDTSGVVGIGIGRRKDQLVLKVNVRSAEDACQVPASIQGVTVVTEVVGEVRKRPRGPQR